MIFLFVLGLLCVWAALFMLYVKYRVVFKGEKCTAQIVGIVDQDCGFYVSGIRVKKHAYIVKIGSKKYYTSHGCIFKSRGKKKIGEEMVVFRNEKYGKEVFKHLDLRIEILSLIMVLCSTLIFFCM